MMYARDILHDYTRILRNIQLTNSDAAEALQAYGYPQTHDDVVRVLVKWINSDSSMVTDDVLHHLREMVIDMDEPFAFMANDLQWVMRWYTVEDETQEQRAARVFSACTNPELMQKYPAMCLEGIATMSRYFTPSVKKNTKPLFHSDPNATRNTENHTSMYMQMQRDLLQVYTHPSMMQYTHDAYEEHIDDYHDILQFQWALSKAIESDDDYEAVDLLQGQSYVWIDDGPPASPIWWASSKLGYMVEKALKESPLKGPETDFIDFQVCLEELLSEETTWTYLFQYPRQLIPGCLVTLLDRLERDTTCPNDDAIPSPSVWKDQWLRCHKKDPVLADTLLFILQQYWNTKDEVAENLRPLLDIPTPQCPTFVRIATQMEQWSFIKTVVLEYGDHLDEYDDIPPNTLSLEMSD